MGLRRPSEGPYKKTLRVLIRPLGAFQGLIRPLGALEDHWGPYEVLRGIIRRLGAL